MRFKKFLLVLPLSILLFACGKKTTTTKKIDTTIRTTIQTTTLATTSNKVTVTFLDDKGVTIQSQEVEKGSVLTEPTISNQTGKEFVGWFYNGSAWPFSDVVNSNMTLVGKWNYKKYDFKIECDSVEYDYSPKATYEQEIVLTAKKIQFCEFDGWYEGDTLLSKDSKYTFNMPAKDYTIIAKYKPMGDADKFEYSFDGNTCKLLCAKTGATFGSVVVVPEGVNIIGDSCLMSMNSNISLLVLPDSVTEIEEDGLLGPCVYAMVVGKNLESIGSYAFDGTGLSIIYYKGTPEEWNTIYIGSYVSIYEEMIHYYSEEEPTTSGYFWHYDDNGSPVAWPTDED